MIWYSGVEKEGTKRSLGLGEAADQDLGLGAPSCKGLAPSAPHQLGLSWGRCCLQLAELVPRRTQEKKLSKRISPFPYLQASPSPDPSSQLILRRTFMISPPPNAENAWLTPTPHPLCTSFMPVIPNLPRPEGREPPRHQTRNEKRQATLE